MAETYRPVCNRASERVLRNLPGPLAAQLELVEPLVEPALGQELPVAAALPDSP